MPVDQEPDINYILDETVTEGAAAKTPFAMPAQVPMPPAMVAAPLSSTTTSSDTTALDMPPVVNPKEIEETHVLEKYASKMDQLAKKFRNHVTDPKYPDVHEFAREEIEKLRDTVRRIAPINWPPVSELSPMRFIQTEPAAFEWIIEDFLSRGVVGLLYGEGGSYKSLAALWLVLQRSLNVPENLWLDHFLINHGRSVFLSAEDLSLDLHHRTRSILKHLREDYPDEDVDAAVAENCLIMSREQWVSDKLLFLVNEQGTATMKKDSIIERVKEFKADLIFVETLSRISGTDENSNQMGARVIGVLEEIRDATGATVIAISHVSKAARSGQGGDTHGQSAARGASSLVDNARWALWFKSLPPTNMGIPCLEVQHAKSFRSMRAKTFRVEVLFPKFVASTTTSEEPSDSLDEKILEYVTKNPGQTLQRVLADLRGDRTGTNNHIRALLDEGRLEQRKDGKKRPIYAVEEASVPSVPELFQNTSE